jgi:nucleoside-diphosphate-sugar epimerase
MRIFLTGGTGFIGSYFLTQALKAGHEIAALRQPGTRPSISLETEPVWVEGQLDDYDEKSLEGCDALVHFAAIGVSPQRATWQDYFYWNVQVSLNLFLKAIEYGIQNFVVCGSCVEYGKSAERYEFIPPNAELEPTDAYGASKAAASIALLSLCREKKLVLSLLRPFTVFGEGQHAENFWPSLKKAALSGQDFSMTAGEQIRDFVTVEHVAGSFLQALGNKNILPGEPVVRNIGSGMPKPLLEFAREWWLKWDAGGKIREGELNYRPNEVMRYVPLID